ncbi:MAG: hypothetical protein ACRCT8_17405 [Lacipirellulaceae bacterium]
MIAALDPQAPPSRRSNPFATCWTRPGAMAFVRSAGVDAPTVAERLATNGWRGQVVGPHGVGKSALLAALARIATERGLATRRLVIDARSRRRVLPLQMNAVLFVEGLERLPGWRRWLLLATAARRPGLVVALHRPSSAPLADLPLVAQLAPSESMLESLYRSLVADRETRVTLDDAREAFRRHGGDYRRVWFDLYDLHEARRPNRARALGVSATSARGGGV